MKVDDYKFYAQAGAELESGEMDKGFGLGHFLKLRIMKARVVCILSIESLNSEILEDG